jgi:hypothetical protein
MRASAVTTHAVRTWTIGVLLTGTYSLKALDAARTLLPASAAGFRIVEGLFATILGKPITVAEAGVTRAAGAHAGAALASSMRRRTRFVARAAAHRG